MAIAHDNSTTGSFAGPGTTTSLTYSKTNTGTSTDGVLWVWMTCARISGGSVAGFTITCTYAGTSMTEIRSGTTTGAVLQTSSTSAGSCLFYLLNPATGANNVVVTLSGTADRIISGASSYTGVNGVNNGNSTTSNGAANSPTLSITSQAGDQAFAGACHGDTITGSGTATNQRFNLNVDNTTAGDNIVGGDEAGAATVSIDFTSSVTDHWALIGGNMQSVSGPPPADILTVTAAGTGNSATSTATLAFDSGDSFAVGDVIVVAISADNAASGGATSLTSVTDAKSHTYTLVQATYDPGAASAGQTIGLAWTTVTTAMITTDQITVNFSPNTTSKAAVVWKLHPDTGAAVEKVAHAFGTGSGTGTPTITTGTIGLGDVVVAALAVETNAAVTADADTTNGAWSAQATATGSTGTVATSSRIASQNKIVTAEATQTYNPTLTSADCIDGWVSFHPYIVNPVVAVPVVAVQRAASW